DLVTHTLLSTLYTFSFHTPLPPDTSPLPLHDALPILLEIRPPLPAALWPVWEPWAMAFSMCSTWARISTFTVCSGIPAELYKNRDRKSTRLNSSHVKISYAVFCLKKKKKKKTKNTQQK